MSNKAHEITNLAITLPLASSKRFNVNGPVKFFPLSDKIFLQLLDAYLVFRRND